MMKLYFDRIRPIEQASAEPKTHGGKSEKFRTITNEELEKIREFIDNCDYVGMYEYIEKTGEKTPNINTYQQKIESHLLNNNYKSLYKYAIYNITGNSSNNDEDIDTMEYEEEKNERQEKEKKDLEENRKVYLYLDLDIDDNSEYQILDNHYYHNNKHIYKVHTTRQVKKTGKGYKVYYPQTIEKEFSDWYIEGLFYKRYLPIDKNMLFISDNIKTNKFNTIIEELKKGPKSVEFIEKYFRTIGYSIEWCLIFRDKYQKEQATTTEEQTEEEEQTSVEELTSVFFNHINNNTTTEEQQENEKEESTDLLYDELDFVTVKKNKVVSINDFRPSQNDYCNLTTRSYKILGNGEEYEVIDDKGVKHNQYEVLTHFENNTTIQIYKIITFVKDRNGKTYKHIYLGINKQNIKRGERFKENLIDDIVYIYNEEDEKNYKRISNIYETETKDNHYLFEKYDIMEALKKKATKKDLIDITFVYSEPTTSTTTKIERVTFKDIPFFNKYRKTTQNYIKQKDFIIDYYVQELDHNSNYKNRKILKIEWDFKYIDLESDHHERRRQQHYKTLIQNDINTIEKTLQREKDSRKVATNEQILQALFR